MNRCVKNKLLIIILSIFAFFSASFGTFVSAETQNSALSFEQVCFFMQSGASVRTVKDSSGLRFTSLMSKSDYNGLIANENYKTLTFGMLILPYDYVTKYGEANYETVFGENAVYGYNGEKNKIQIINLSNDEMYEFVYDKNYMAFNGVIINMYESNFCRQFVGVGYMSAQTDGGLIYKFAGSENNIRSVAYVAGKAMSNGSEGEVLEILQNYVNKSSSEKTSYTVRTHTCGSIETISEEVFETTVGTVVSTSAGNVDGYSLDTDRSVLSSIALANDATVLDVYYESNESCTVDLTDSVYCSFDLTNDEFTLDTSSFYGVVEKIGGVSVSEVDGRVTVDKNTLLSLNTKRLDDYTGNGGAFLWKVNTSCRTYKIKVILADKIIKTAEDFSMLEDSSGYYVLGNDVFVDGELKISQFSGVLDGNGHKAANITVTDGKGIFTTVNESGVIKNIAFINVNSTNCCLTNALNGKVENVFIHSNNAQTVVNNECGSVNKLVCNLPNGKFVFRTYNPTGDAIADNIYAIVGNATGNENYIGICNKVQSYNGLSNTVCNVTVKDFLSALNDLSGLGDFWQGNGSSYLKFGNNYVLTA